MNRKVSSKRSRVETVSITLEVPKALYESYVEFLRWYRITPVEFLLNAVFDAATNHHDEEVMRSMLDEIIDRTDRGYAVAFAEAEVSA